MTQYSSRLAPLGAHLLDRQRTAFRLWAPACRTVTLEIEGSAPLPMQRDGDGLFCVEAACGAGARYRYRVDEQRLVPDPASRAQAGDVHDASMVVDPNAYRWRCEKWRGRPWREIVIYELHVGCFGGAGRNFRGVTARLPELKDVGITAIELMPVAEFRGRRNWGYDGVLPYAPDAAYGSPADLKNLVDTAHELGLCVYLDVVYNHFGPDGNYLHLYAPDFFDQHRQSPWGAAIDFSVAQVREFFIGNALYWLNEFRFDGLRLDAVHAIADPGFVQELGTRVRGTVQPDRHIHLMLENEHNDVRHLEAGFDAQWNDDVHNALHVLLTGEQQGYYAAYADSPAQRFARCLAEGFAYQGEPSVCHGGRPRGTPSAHLPPHAFIFFLQNHDQVGNRAFGERLTTLAHPSALRAAIVVQLLSPQIPLLFMGEERGARNPFLYFTDFDQELGAKVREGRRREFAAFAEFADEAKRQTIPEPNDEATFLASIVAHAAADELAKDRLELYRNLLRLRQAEIAPRLAGVCGVDARALGAAAIAASWRLGDGTLLHIAANFDVAPVDLAPFVGRLLFATADEAAAAAAVGRLPGRSAAAFLEHP